MPPTVEDVPPSIETHAGMSAILEENAVTFPTVEWRGDDALRHKLWVRAVTLQCTPRQTRKVHVGEFSQAPMKVVQENARTLQIGQAKRRLGFALDIFAIDKDI